MPYTVGSPDLGLAETVYLLAGGPTLLIVMVVMGFVNVRATPTMAVHGLAFYVVVALAAATTVLLAGHAGRHSSPLDVSLVLLPFAVAVVAAVLLRPETDTRTVVRSTTVFTWFDVTGYLTIAALRLRRRTQSAEETMESCP